MARLMMKSCLLTFLLIVQTSLTFGFHVNPKTNEVPAKAGTFAKKLHVRNNNVPDLVRVRGGGMSAATSPQSVLSTAFNFPMLVQLCGKLAPMASMALSFTPLPTIMDIQKEKSVGDLPLLPYSSLVCNAIIWTTYGLLKKDPKIWSCNVVGAILGSYYTWAFTRFSPSKSPTLPGSVKSHFSTILSVLCFAVIVALRLPVEKAVAALGALGVTVCLILFGSPLSALKTVVKTKSAKSIPLPFTIGTVANCAFWVVIGIDTRDFNIYFPNSLGLFFGFVQIALKLIYGDGMTPELSAV